MMRTRKNSLHTGETGGNSQEELENEKELMNTMETVRGGSGCPVGTLSCLIRCQQDSLFHSVRSNGGRKLPEGT
jgi:2-methylaconitate cis-trans-isomerase PrpF